jgi:L-ascorbate metabolism protein UlaG (beta-lactamase superfamily)
MSVVPGTEAETDLAGAVANGAFDRGEVQFVGTATVLIRYGGFVVLTDPNFLHRGERAKLGYGLRSRRLTEPALGVEDLPALDLVVLSHHHGDHFDDVAAARLDHGLPIVTTPHAARKLGRQGFTNPRPLRTWQRLTFRRGDASLTMTSLPARHGPGPLNRLLPPVMGTMLDFADRDGLALRVYLSGDTLAHDRLADIPRRLPGIDLAIVHLGGTRILGVLLTMDAAQGAAAIGTLSPRAAIPVHYDDYTVFRSPLSAFQAVAGDRLGPTVIHYLQRGQAHRFNVDSRRPQWTPAELC